MDVAGDTIVARGEVTATQEIAGLGFVTCRIRLDNQRGETSTAGWATGVLPLRGGRPVPTRSRAGRNSPDSPCRRKRSAFRFSHHEPCFMQENPPALRQEARRLTWHGGGVTERQPGAQPAVFRTESRKARPMTPHGALPRLPAAAPRLPAPSQV
jgi:hypothetical protein